MPQSWADSASRLGALLSRQPLSASCPPPPPGKVAPGPLNNCLKKWEAVGVCSQDSAGDGRPGPGKGIWEGTAPPTHPLNSRLHIAANTILPKCKSDDALPLPCNLPGAPQQDPVWGARLSSIQHPPSLPPPGPLSTLACLPLPPWGCPVCDSVHMPC